MIERPQLYRPAPRWPHLWEAGDLVLFWGRGWTSRIIELGTRGPSHVGIIAPSGEKLLLFESTTLCNLPCEIARRRHSGVQAHDPDARIESYEGRIARLRLADDWKLDEEERELLGRLVLRKIGFGYDAPGAILSGTKLFRFSRLMPYPDVGSLFCSEMCAHVLMRLQRLELDNSSKFNPGYLVRRLRAAGTYGAPEWITTAASIGENR